ncbi:hypothetical protein SAMN04487949_3682 [Halogranum gelatinilyticum]|uniref:Membrane protein YjdF n=1 Tax=Halogranum gelatinilyticum TaxID=660521 RepID=A0A1G9ZP41_9EURY|nr:hypothetical protein [Halogranum gelatinilyticum]SDN22393.1 hypothetical protein SAMN04487949_3682 [Halogranum gelatinilyticum]
MKLRDRLHLSKGRQSQLVRFLQFVMVGILSIGLYLGNMGVVVNAAVGLLVTFLPAYLERNYRFTMDVALVLWITVAMFLHAFGTLPLPGLEFTSAYSATWWWDHMTHALSSSLVAGVAYAIVRALDEHSEFIHMPPKFLFVFMLMFVMAFGVVWELLEFYISVVSALLGAETVLTQYGLGDTVLDLFYNSVGGLLVAIFGSAYLTGVSGQLAERLGAQSAKR